MDRYILQINFVRFNRCTVSVHLVRWTGSRQCVFRLGGYEWVDAVEIGTWAKLEQIVEFRSRLGNIPFTFHAGGMAAQVGWKKDWIVQMRNYLEISRGKWISLHLLPILPAAETKMRQGVALQIPAALALQVMKWQIYKIKSDNEGISIVREY